MSVFVEVNSTVALADGVEGSNLALGTELAVGCARLIGWQEDKNAIRSRVMINFLSTFGVYHKIYRSHLD